MKRNLHKATVEKISNHLNFKQNNFNILSRFLKYFLHLITCVQILHSIVLQLNHDQIILFLNGKIQLIFKSSPNIDVVVLFIDNKQQ